MASQTYLITIIALGLILFGCLSQPTESISSTESTTPTESLQETGFLASLVRILQLGFFGLVGVAVIYVIYKSIKGAKFAFKRVGDGAKKTKEQKNTELRAKFESEVSRQGGYFTDLFPKLSDIKVFDYTYSPLPTHSEVRTELHEKIKLSDIYSLVKRFGGLPFEMKPKTKPAGLFFARLVTPLRIMIGIKPKEGYVIFSDARNNIVGKITDDLVRVELNGVYVGSFDFKDQKIMDVDGTIIGSFEIPLLLLPFVDILGKVTIGNITAKVYASRSLPVLFDLGRVFNLFVPDNAIDELPQDRKALLLLVALFVRGFGLRSKN